MLSVRRTDRGLGADRPLFAHAVPRARAEGVQHSTTETAPRNVRVYMAEDLFRDVE